MILEDMGHVLQVSTVQDQILLEYLVHQGITALTEVIPSQSDAPGALSTFYLGKRIVLYALLVGYVQLKD